MSTLRFRAWHEKTKTMFPLHMDDNWQVYFDNDAAWLPKSEMVVMQSTGLKDKNGVEIFEGDLIRIGEPLSIQKEWVLVVEYGDCGYGRDAYDHHLGFYARELGKTSRQGIRGAIWKSEVIGNIYQNPSLLPL